MNFRAWFIEWGGFAHIGEPGANGTGNYGDVGPQTRYNGHGATYGAKSHLDQVEKMYKLKPPLVVKRMKKKG